MIFLARLLVVLLFQWNFRRGSDAQITYSIKPTWMEDPEYTWSVAPDEKGWASLKKGAENLGLTFAGKAEFPWIVDIRVDGKDQEYYSTGNLVKQDTVFTTCRAVEDLGDFRSGATQPRVTFAQMYLFEYTEREIPTGQDWRYGGHRKVKSVTKHKNCNIQMQYYDGALITLINNIISSPPTINTIQLTIDYTDGGLPDFDLQRMVEQRRICYIASFGRDYLNIKDTLVKDFKVKYRVYYEKPDSCYGWKDAMCPNRHLSSDSCQIGNGSPEDEGVQLMCFKSRAKVGAVCDHDKGAPLVCDGQVFGLVILGARMDHCNDLLALPFWVQKVSMYRDWFEPQEKPPNRRSLNSRRAGSAGNHQFAPNHILQMIILLASLLTDVFRS